MYHAIHSCPKLVISAVQGAAIAGALGILSCSDVVIAEAKTVFCLSEVKIGLVPGIVGTFLIPRLGLSWFRYFAKTGIAFDSETAKPAGLIHEIADGKNKVEECVDKHIKLALSASPAAIAKTNDLIGSIGYKLKEDALAELLKDFNNEDAFRETDDGKYEVALDGEKVREAARAMLAD